MDEYICKQCGKKLINTCFFCDIYCETEFRDSIQELSIKYKDGNYQWVCPILKFEETESNLICDNGYSTYTFDKKDIEKWKIDRCSCLQEFINIDVKF